LVLMVPVFTVLTGCLSQLAAGRCAAALAAAGQRFPWPGALPRVVRSGSAATLTSAVNPRPASETEDLHRQSLVFHGRPGRLSARHPV
jgi:hypothetical protein